ncbi:MAG: hypothetical protein EBT70_17275 [Betaproteobacteria bacterium]|nr:hypothetical protein [Betaproteobacteria bacterium]
MHQKRPGPQPVEPLCQAMKTDETTLFPGLHSLGEIHAGGELINPQNQQQLNRHHQAQGPSQGQTQSQ